MECLSSEFSSRPPGHPCDRGPDLEAQRVGKVTPGAPPAGCQTPGRLPCRPALPPDQAPRALATPAPQAGSAALQLRTWRNLMNLGASPVERPSKQPISCLAGSDVRRSEP